MNSQIESLEKSIKQWEIIYMLVKEDDNNTFVDITDAKSKALNQMRVKTYIIYSCFLCDKFHQSIKRTCECKECPMYGYWPNIDKNKSPVIHCFHSESLYSDIEQSYHLKPNKIKRILKAMKKRLKEIKNEG